jgi:hypothetical protein
MPGGDGEADLVVELGRRRDVAFLLDVESHAGGPDQDAATLRTERLGDNSLVGLCPCANCLRPVQFSVWGSLRAMSRSFLIAMNLENAASDEEGIALVMVFVKYQVGIFAMTFLH